MMWCGGCYKDHNNYKFPGGGKPIGGGWGDEAEIRYYRGRSGDHFITYFQCEKFHFMNIQGRDSGSMADKDMILIFPR